MQAPNCSVNFIGYIPELPCLIGWSSGSTSLNEVPSDNSMRSASNKICSLFGKQKPFNDDHSKHRSSMMELIFGRLHCEFWFGIFRTPKRARQSFENFLRDSPIPGQPDAKAALWDNGQHLIFLIFWAINFTEFTLLAQFKSGALGSLDSSASNRISSQYIWAPVKRLEFRQHRAKWGPKKSARLRDPILDRSDSYFDSEIHSSRSRPPAERSKANHCHTVLCEFRTKSICRGESQKNPFTSTDPARTPRISSE